MSLRFYLTNSHIELRCLYIALTVRYHRVIQVHSNRWWDGCRSNKPRTKYFSFNIEQVSYKAKWIYVSSHKQVRRKAPQIPGLYRAKKIYTQKYTRRYTIWNRFGNEEQNQMMMLSMTRKELKVIWKWYLPIVYCWRYYPGITDIQFSIDWHCQDFHFRYQIKKPVSSKKLWRLGCGVDRDQSTW